MTTECTEPEKAKRINDEIYLAKVPYGPENNGLSDSFEEKYDMPIEYFIRLFVQSIVLNSIISQDFPYSVKNWIRNCFDNQVKLFCSSPLTPQNGVQIIQNLINDIVMQLNIIVDNIESIKDKLKITDEELNEVSIKRDAVVSTLMEYFNQVNMLFEESKESCERRQAIEVAVKYIDNAHNDGQFWAKDFFSVINDFKKAELFYKNYPIKYGKAKSGSLQLETRVSHCGRRYLHLTFAPTDFLISQFVILPFWFFHEYLSHLNAGLLDPGNVNNHVMPNLTNPKFHPVELTEGWMLFTARTFFEENAENLLGSENRIHLIPDILLEIDKTTLINRDIGNEGYTEMIHFGYDLACRFLKLLESKSFSDKEMQAKKLFYRFSVDLITYYVEDAGNFSQRDFIYKLGFWIRQYPEDLIHVVKLSIGNADGLDYIDVLKLWSFLRSKDLSISL